MRLAEGDRDAVVELPGEERASEVVERGTGSEVVAEPEAGHFEVGALGEVAEIGGGVLAEVAGVAGIFPDDLKWAVPAEQAKALAKANGVGRLED